MQNVIRPVSPAKTIACCNVCNKDNVWTIADCLCDTCLRRTCEACTPDEWRCDYCFRLNCPCNSGECSCFKPTEDRTCTLCSQKFVPQDPLHYECTSCHQEVCHVCIIKNPDFELPTPCRECQSHEPFHSYADMTRDDFRLWRAEDVQYISEYSDRNRAVIRAGKLTQDIVAHLLTTIPVMHWSTSHEMEDQVIDWFISCINNDYYSLDEIKTIASLLREMKEARDDYRVYA